MSAAVDKKGLKRVCSDCGVRFYDMNKRPIICPSCGVEFLGVEKVKPRRRGKAETPEKDQVIEKKAVATDDEDELEDEDDGVEVIDLDSAAALETGGDSDDDALVPDLDDEGGLEDLDVDLEPSNADDDINDEDVV